MNWISWYKTEFEYSYEFGHISEIKRTVKLDGIWTGDKQLNIGLQAYHN